MKAAKLTSPKANVTVEHGRPTKPNGWQPMPNAELVRVMGMFRNDHRTQP